MGPPKKIPISEKEIQFLPYLCFLSVSGESPQQQATIKGVHLNQIPVSQREKKQE